jgi:hypothetical protein
MTRMMAQEIVGGTVIMAFVDALHWSVWSLPLEGVTGKKLHSGGASDLADAKTQARSHFGQAVKAKRAQGARDDG